MRRQVITAYCDMCNTALDKEVEAVTSVSYAISNPTHMLNPNPVMAGHVLDLCEEHAGMLMKILDIAEPIKPSSERRRGPDKKRYSNLVPCEWCDRYIGTRGFVNHVRGSHPDIDIGIAKEYLKGVKQDQLGRKNND